MMKNTSYYLKIIATLLFFQFSASILKAEVIVQDQPVRILADLNLLKTQGIKPIQSLGGLGIAEISEYQALALSHSAHQFHKCAGFERLDNNKSSNSILRSLVSLNVLNQNLESPRLAQLPFNQKTQDLVNLVSAQQIESDIRWLSSFTTRYHKSVNNNQHVLELQKQLSDLMKWSSQVWSVETIDHNNTPQKSLRVRIEGSVFPNEIVVLGGHLDSISGYGSSSAKAPGADDNASGSANLLETLRIISQSGRPQRTIEFFWYAGEEAGLLGSAEIAIDYKEKGKDVISVLQLDMTAYPGVAEGTIGDVTDYTNPTLRAFWAQLNANYVHAKFVEDKCGYACSDHASWFRQGYPTVLPFEATTQTMNSNIHTARDLYDSRLNINHAKLFSKLAVAYAYELGNSRWRAN